LTLYVGGELWYACPYIQLRAPSASAQWPEAPVAFRPFLRLELKENESQRDLK